MTIVRPDPAIDPLIGQLVGGRYTLLRRVGKGGMGVVYEADHTNLGKRVAVKLLLDKYTDDPEVVARFQREARTASSIGDQHIVEVTDAGMHDDGRSFIVMELLEGQNLAETLEACGPMPAVRAVEIVRQVLRGLGAAHAKGIVHRDMKPENVFLTTRGGSADFAKIMDFGISKFLMSTESKVRLTATGAVIGTPVYMAPEQALALGEVDARVDLYAVGVMLYELLAGHPPFQAPSYIALVTQHLNLPPPPLGEARPDLPRALIKAVHRALEKDPARRYQTAAEMAAAIPTVEALLAADSVSTLGSSNEYPGLSASQTMEASPMARRSPGSPVSMPAQATPLYQTPGPSGAVGVLPTGTHVIGMEPGATGAGEAARSRWPIAIAGVAVLIAAVILVVGLGGDRGRSAAGSAAGSASAQPGPASAPPGPGTAALAPLPEVGSLEIMSTPPGAIVFVDGVERGKTPLVVAEVAPGIHEIRLSKPGFAELTMNKSVRAGRDETISASLARGAAGAKVRPVKTPRQGTGPATTPETTTPRKVETTPTTTPRKVETNPRNPYDDDPGTTPNRDTKKNPYD